jgi:hypothetical protein
MIDVEIRQHLRCSPDEAFAFLADATHNPRWQRGMVSCRWQRPGPILVGSRYEQEARFLGRTIRSLFEVTEFEDGRSIRIETVESTFPIQVTRSVEPAPGGCMALATVSGAPSGWLRLLGPLLKPMLRASVRADYRRLASLMADG